MSMAYVNHGRWVAYCEHCDELNIVRPPNKEFLCASGMCKPHEKTSSVCFPNNWRDGFEVLRLRPVSKMNWLDSETVDDLRAENIAHGVK